MNFLRQFLPSLFMPLSVSMVLLLSGHLLRRRVLVWTALILLWISSVPVIGRLLVRIAEGPAEHTLATQAPISDAIVVLSAGRFIAPGRAAISEWEDADRFFGGVELFQAGKARLLVFTGALPDGPIGAPLEGETLAAYARTLGVASDRIAITGAVANTEDEAREVAALLLGRKMGAMRVLLVTSAFHMPRARRLFEHAGLVVAPFPVDFRPVGDGRFRLLDFLPSASALNQTQAILHELYGRLFYQFVGPAHSNDSRTL